MSKLAEVFSCPNCGELTEFTEGKNNCNTCNYEFEVKLNPFGEFYKVVVECLSCENPMEVSVFGNMCECGHDFHTLENRKFKEYGLSVWEIQ